MSPTNRLWAIEVARYAISTPHVTGSLPLPLSTLIQMLVQDHVVLTESKATDSVYYLAEHMSKSFQVCSLGSTGTGACLSQQSAYLNFIDTGSLKTWISSVETPKLSQLNFETPGLQIWNNYNTIWGPSTPSTSSTWRSLSPASSKSDSLTSHDSDDCYSSSKKNISQELLDLILYPSKTVLESMVDELLTLLSYQSPRELRRRQAATSDCNLVYLTETCRSRDRKACLASGHKDCTRKIHYEQLGTGTGRSDCSYIDGCFQKNACRFRHYAEVDPTEYVVQVPSSQNKLTASSEFLQAQYGKCDIRQLKLNKLGNDYKALVVDPPWNIHTGGKNCPLGTLTDDEIKNLDIGSLQTDGVILLSVTGRTIDLGYQLLAKWGYNQTVEELMWCKVNALGRTICTGRTGHWLNHTKEHYLLGVKGNPELNWGVDVDVLVSRTRSQAQKPTEIYGIIDRLAGSSCSKLELFGTKNNIRPGWLTIGADLPGTKIIEKDAQKRWVAATRRVV